MSAPVSGSRLVQQAFVDEGAYIQRLVDERVDIDIALARHFQCVMKIILLFFDDGIRQGFGHWQVQWLARKLWLVKPQETVALFQAQQAIERFLLCGACGVTEQRSLETEMVVYFLKTMHGRVEIVAFGADHHGACKFYEVRLIFPEANRFDEQQCLVSTGRSEQPEQLTTLFLRQLSFSRSTRMVAQSPSWMTWESSLRRDI